MGHQCTLYVSDRFAAFRIILVECPLFLCILIFGVSHNYLNMSVTVKQVRTIAFDLHFTAQLYVRCADTVFLAPLLAWC